MHIPYKDKMETVDRAFKLRQYIDVTVELMLHEAYLLLGHQNACFSDGALLQWLRRYFSGTRGILAGDGLGS